MEIGLSAKNLEWHVGQTTVKGKIHKNLGFSMIIIRALIASVYQRSLYKCIIYRKHIKAGNTN